VISAITEILGPAGSVDEAELKQLVAQKLASGGKSRIGLALRFTEAMNDDRFIRSEDALVALNPEEASV
jgi:hypothetical protein